MAPLPDATHHHVLVELRAAMREVESAERAATPKAGRMNFELVRTTLNECHKAFNDEWDQARATGILNKAGA